MGTNADLPYNNHSPRDGPTPRDGPNSPQSHRANNTRNLSSPWTHVLRGGSSTSINEREAVPAAAATTTPPPSSLSVADIPPPDPAPEPAYSPEKPLPPGNAVVEPLTESSDKAAHGSSNAARAMKKQAWNRPSNGVIDAGPVMGDNWPALSESARASAKSSDSLKAPSDGSVPVSISPGPVIASSPHKPTTNNANPNLIPNHAFPARHKPAKRGSSGGGGGGGMGPANNGSFMPPPVETPHSASDKVVAAEVVLDSSPRDPPHKNSNWETGPQGPFIPQPHIGTDQPRSSSRRGNGGRGGGDGNYHSNYMNRREQERPNYEWNHPQSFSGRDAPMRQQRVVPRNFIRLPPPAPAPFVSPPPIRRYGGPMGFPDLSSPQYYIPVPPPESLRGGPFVAHPGPPAHVFFPPLDSQLRTMLVKQIDYYFSSENLCKDLYLRRNMDEHGWVPVSLIANFNRVKQITNSIQFILDTVQMSTIVEVQGEKIRKRNDWMTWILPPTNQSAASLGPLSPGISNYDMLATGMQNIGLEEWTGNNNSMNGPMHPHTDGVLTRSSSSESNSQSQVAMPTGTSNGEGTGQRITQMGSDRPTSMRS